MSKFVPNYQFPVRWIDYSVAPQLVVIYVGLTFFSGAFHLALGADPIVVGLCVASVVLSVVPAAMYGWRDMPSLISLAVGLHYAASALVWKLIEWDALDHGLYEPQTSFIVILIGTFAVMVAALACRLIWKAPPVFREQYQVPGLQLLMVFGIVIWMAYWLARQFLDPNDLLGGIYAILQRSGGLAPVAWLALNMQRQRRPFSLSFIVYGCITLVLSLAFNSRQQILILFLTVATFLVCYRIKIKPMMVVYGGIFLAFFVLIVSPTVSSENIRGMRSELDAITLIGITLNEIEKKIVGESLSEDIGESNYRLQYLKSTNDFATRMVNVQQLDFIVAEVENQGPIGTDRFWRGVLEILPSALVTKTVQQGDYALWVYQVSEWGEDSSTETTTFGDAYVFNGYSFVALSTFFAYLGWFVFFRLVCPNFQNSILAVYIISTYIWPLTTATVLGVISPLAREMPILVALFWIANRFTSRQFVSASFGGPGQRSIRGQ